MYMIKIFLYECSKFYRCKKIETFIQLLPSNNILRRVQMKKCFVERTNTTLRNVYVDGLIKVITRIESVKTSDLDRNYRELLGLQRTHEYHELRWSQGKDNGTGIVYVQSRNTKTK